MAAADKLELIPIGGNRPDQQVYALNGPLTLGDLLVVQGALRSPAQVLVLDLADVPFIDSAGIGCSSSDLRHAQSKESVRS